MPDKTLVPARKLLNRLRLLMEQDFETSGIRMDIESEPADLDLYIDEKQISQVLINLCKNALQSLASQHDGWVTVKAGVNNEDKKYLSVTDNGPGIPQEQLEEIFLPFYTTKEKGTGIGLSLSKQILHLHRGNLQVHSDPGRETVFVLTF